MSGRCLILRNIDSSLRNRCKVNTNTDEDRFVGIRIEDDGLKVNFPIGYELSKTNDGIREDIYTLINVLSFFMQESGGLREVGLIEDEQNNFPVSSYLTIIKDFLNRGCYYVDIESKYTTNNKGAVSWARTIKQQKGIIQSNKSLVYTNMTVKVKHTNPNKEITQIHRYCVYEAFEKLGILFTKYMPEKPDLCPTVTESVHILNQRLIATQKDSEQELFKAMRDMLIFKEYNLTDNIPFFGTEKFENVWEYMVDKAFGTEDRREYLPRAKWNLKYGTYKNGIPLLPDSIMFYNGKYYVLDAKYYRYGWTGNPNHLPTGQDINKQITYGEYIARTKGIEDDYLFNAFIMPYNKSDNLFDLSDDICNIGEAIGEWRLDRGSTNMYNYERIQGILVDTKFLMNNYISVFQNSRTHLVACIEEVLLKEDIKS